MRNLIVKLVASLAVLLVPLAYALMQLGDVNYQYFITISYLIFVLLLALFCCHTQWALYDIRKKLAQEAEQDD